VNAVVTDKKHDRVELNHISYESSQSSQGDDCSTNTRKSHRGGGGLRDELSASDDSSSKAQAPTKDKLSLSKTDLIAGSHGTSNSSV